MKPQMKSKFHEQSQESLKKLKKLTMIKLKTDKVTDEKTDKKGNRLIMKQEVKSFDDKVLKEISLDKSILGWSQKTQ